MLALTDLVLLVSVAIAVIAVTPFLGRYMARVLEGETTFLSPIVRPVERLVYRVCGIDETSEQGWKAYAVALLVFSLTGIVVMYAMLRLQDILPLNPNGVASVLAGPRLQHGGQLRDEHELAELLRRGREPPHPVGRSRGPELHLRCGGHRDRRRAHPRPRPPQLLDDRQLLGRHHPRDPVHPAAARRRRCDRACLAGRHPDLRRAGGREHARRSGADDRARPVRVAGDHQGARHQRRRAAQRELGAPVREPDAADELDRDARRSSSSRSA